MTKRALGVIVLTIIALVLSVFTTIGPALPGVAAQSSAPGTAWGWGNWPVGDGTDYNYTSPVQVVGSSGLGGLKNVVAVSAGNQHGLALKGDGTVWAWGVNSDGRVGDGTTTNRLTPVQVVTGTGPLAGVSAVAAGGWFSLALKSDGSVWQWGSGVSSVATQVGGLSGITAIAAGNTHGLALAGAGTVWSWTPGGTPAQVMTGAAPAPAFGGVSAIAAGNAHSLALRTDGTLWAWGNNSLGQLGVGDTGDRTYPVPVAPTLTFRAISAGDGLSMALTTAGFVYAWGDDAYGQVGNGAEAGACAVLISTRACVTAPAQVVGLSGVTAIDAGYYHGLAVKGDGSVWSWGSNLYGALGHPTSELCTINTNDYACSRSPGQVVGPGGAGVFGAAGAVAGGGYHSYALAPDLTWAGGASTDWSAAATWTPGLVPGPANDVYVETSTDAQQVVVSQPASANNITVNGAGHLRVHNGGTLTVRPGRTLGGSGNLIVGNSGTLTVDGTYGLTGWVTVAGNETGVVPAPVPGKLNLNGPVGATISSLINHGVANFNADPALTPVNVSQLTVNYGGTVNVNRPLTVLVGANLYGGGTIGGSGLLTVNGSLWWSDATMTGSGSTVMAAGSHLDIGQADPAQAPSAAYLDGRTFVNNGSAVLTANANTTPAAGMPGTHGNVLAIAGTTFRNNGTFTIEDGTITWGGGGWANATFANSAGATFTKAGAGTAGVWTRFDNAGIVNVNAGTLAFSGQDPTRGAFVQSSGLLRLAGGNLASAGDLGIQGGALVGSGVVTGDVVVSGTIIDGVVVGGRVQPGGWISTGTLTITGNYTQTGGRLDIDLWNPLQYDQLVVNGVAAFPIAQSGAPNQTFLELFLDPYAGNATQQSLALGGATYNAISSGSLAGWPGTRNGIPIGYHVYPTGTAVVVAPLVNDAIPPTTTIHFAGSRAPGGWYSSPVTVILNADDGAGGSGVSSTQYSLDNTTWAPYNAPFTIGPDVASQTVYFRSTDVNANVELTKQAVYDPWLGFPAINSAVTDRVLGTTRVEGVFESETTSYTYAVALYAGVACPAPGSAPNYTAPLAAATTSATSGGSFAASIVGHVPEPLGLAAVTTKNGVTYSWCRQVSEENLTWLDAYAMEAVTGQTASFAEQPYFVDAFQEKWFKVPVSPDGTVRVRYTGKPGSVVTVHRDPQPLYTILADLINNPTASSKQALSAEAAGGSFLPGNYLPGNYLPGNYLPGNYLPGNYLPGNYLPGNYLPGNYLPGNYLPGNYLPGNYLPGNYLPGNYLPGNYLPGNYLPGNYLPGNYLPGNYLPSTYLPDAYAGAAAWSLMAYSVDPAATVHTLEVPTYDLADHVFVRVAAPFDQAQPGTLEVAVAGDSACTNVTSNFTSTSVAGVNLGTTYKTLILTDSSRLAGTETSAALTSLGTLGLRWEVNGPVVDLSSASNYPRVAEARAQALAHPACPAASNILAQEIKSVIDAYWATNPGLEYIVLAGGHDVIPFFLRPDRSGLGFENEYFPPLKWDSLSDAALRKNRVQTQDPYGARFEVVRGAYTFSVPELAVGRLVDTAADVKSAADVAVAAFARNGGVITPTSALVTGYDFVSDGAIAMQGVLQAGMAAGSPIHALIQTEGTASTHTTAWNANQLRAELLAPDTDDHDLIVFNGHFGAGDLLAADLNSTMNASELATAATTFTDDFVMSLGCHGGYSIPLGDEINGVTPHPVWAQAFLRKGALGFLGATGYAYGDTVLVEYGERLFQRYAEQLRLGNEPVSTGKALVAAKNAYLAETATLTGLDEKTVVEMALYGLPMMKIDFANRVTQPDPSIVGALNTEIADKLYSADVSITPSLTLETARLTSADGLPAIDATYLVGSDGVVASPAEPVLPREVRNVDKPGNRVRGVALRGGTYQELAGITPLTSAPGVQSSFANVLFNSEVFYRTQLAEINYFDALAGGSPRLIAIPAQFKSDGPTSQTGTLREYTGLDFRLYYCPDTGCGLAGTAPAVADVSVRTSSSGVTFSVRVLDDGKNGVQDVWILYTGTSTALSGRWQAFDNLTSPLVDPTMFEGTLNISEADMAGMVFMVQAVSRTGLPTLATNNGALYNVGAADAPAPAGKATTLTLETTAVTGAYGSNGTFTAVLKEGVNPLAGQTVRFDVGGRSVVATSDTTGRASVTVPLLYVPGEHGVRAAFGGNSTYLASSTAPATFQVTKAGTALALATSADGKTFVATLTENVGGEPLGGKSVYFAVSGASGTYYYGSATTNYLGRAIFGGGPLAVGTYAVTAYFSGAIPLPGGGGAVLEDKYYAPSRASGQLAVNVVSGISGPTGPVAVGTNVDLSATLVAACASCTATWSWGDGSSAGGTISSATPSVVAGSHVYNGPGVHTVTLRVTDGGNVVGELAFQYVVVYDPTAGFVTGGGWINSPLGAYLANPSLAGKATFGFVSKYQKGTSIPTGTTAFEFSVAGMQFESTSYDWLVVSGTKAQFKGSGTINDAGNYGFILSAVDGGSTGTDKFRIKIWDKANGNAIVYDNQLGAADDAEASTDIGGGSIVIHTPKK